jgi:hypothetical protein
MTKKKKSVQFCCLICVLLLGLFTAIGSGGGGGDSSSGTPTDTTTTTMVPTTTTTTTTMPTDTAEILGDYNSALENLVINNHAFVESAVEWEGANLDQMRVQDALDLVNQYIEAGFNLHSAVENLNTQAQSASQISKSLSAVFSTKDAAGEAISVLPDVGNGLSPGFAKTIGDIPNGAYNEVNAAIARHPNYENDEGQAALLMQELQDIRKKYVVKAFNTGVETYAGVASGIIGGGVTYGLISAGVITVGSPVLVVVGAAALTGYVGSKVFSWMFVPQGCSGSSDKERIVKSDQVCTLSTGTIEAGGTMPGHFTEGGSLVLSMPGHVPVTITNFQPPTDGNMLVIDFTPIPLSEVDPDDTITVSMEEILAVASQCSEIVSVFAITSPADPAPGQDVTVTATVQPAVSGCNVEYSWSGTDGWHDSGTLQTNSNGQISFVIPGAAEGVHDTVIVSSNGRQHTVVYTF